MVRKEKLDHLALSRVRMSTLQLNELAQVQLGMKSGLIIEHMTWGEEEIERGYN